MAGKDLDGYRMSVNHPESLRIVSFANQLLVGRCAAVDIGAGFSVFAFWCDVTFTARCDLLFARRSRKLLWQSVHLSWGVEG